MDSLSEDWLSQELNSIEDEIASWSEGLKDSYDSLFAPSEVPPTLDGEPPQGE